ncbi:MAG: hypothetical protein L0211_14760 [Planctomycetaceae bacterium]|nr:hypothetical protein [Planctomycetaceae bacterium]MCI0639619.1 hypothetical protein [Gemmataceae bacterium]
MITARPSARARQWFEDTYARINTTDTFLRLKDQVFSPAELKELGPDHYATFRRLGVTGMWMKLHGCPLSRAVIEIASALDGLGPTTRDWLLREVGESADDSEAAIERAVQSGALVLLDRPRTAFFGGRQIEVDWDAQAASWAYLELLARGGKAGGIIDHMSVGNNAAEDILKRRKNRLKNLPGMSTQLIDLIVCAGRRTQHLELPPAQIRIFECVGNDEYREWRP